jgi:hypothetical protein
VAANIETFDTTTGVAHVTSKAPAQWAFSPTCSIRGKRTVEISTLSV